MTKAKQLPSRKHKEDLLSSHTKSDRPINQDYLLKPKYVIESKGRTPHSVYSDKSIEEIKRLNPGCTVRPVHNPFRKEEMVEVEEVDIDPYN